MGLLGEGLVRTIKKRRKMHLPESRLPSEKQMSPMECNHGFGLLEDCHLVAGAVSSVSFHHPVRPVTAERPFSLTHFGTISASDQHWLKHNT